MSPFQSQVYRIVSRCPRGRVVSYGGVAALAGKPRASRAVGAAMRDLPADSKIPWWRVINSKGEISMRDIGHGPAIQRQLLQREGIRLSKAGRVDWEKFGWNGE